MYARCDLNQATKLWLSSVILYGIALLFIRFTPHYSWFIELPVQNFLYYLYLIFFIFSTPYYIFTTTRYDVNKPLIIFQFIKKNFIALQKSTFIHLNQKEKTAILFIVVKFFFLPLMFQFLYQNFNDLVRIFSEPFIYAFFLILLFTIDTAIFAFGYTFEFNFLRNKVRSVEPTIFGWFVALICYPPFNWHVGNFIPWGASDYAFFWNPTLDAILKFIVIILLVVYTTASIFLGPKASNLTNRGIVTTGPYKYVRHPAYICKTSIWWLTLLPVITLPFAFGMFFWTVIYYFRALTEERHLSLDPDYQDYKKKVKYKFVPFVY
jgi:protein-S-isoprenylcysteine O-methyltransferase Ste14